MWDLPAEDEKEMMIPIAIKNTSDDVILFFYQSGKEKHFLKLICMHFFIQWDNRFTKGSNFQAPFFH